MSKNAIRSAMRARRAELSMAWIREHSLSAQERLAALHVFAASAAVGLYFAMPVEAGTDVLFSACRDAGKQVAVPARRGDLYEFVNYVPGTTLVAGPCGIPEPGGAAARDPGELELVVVPGVAFDAAGGRLGHGGGYYDRLLAALAPSCVTLGLAFDFQVVPTVPMEEFDVRLDGVVTETRVLGFAE